MGGGLGLVQVLGMKRFKLDVQGGGSVAWMASVSKTAVQSPPLLLSAGTAVELGAQAQV